METDREVHDMVTEVHDSLRHDNISKAVQDIDTVATEV